jgi:hypothetical protein
MLTEQFEEMKRQSILSFGDDMKNGLNDAFVDIEKKNDNICRMSEDVKQLSAPTKEMIEDARENLADIQKCCEKIKNVCENPFGYGGQHGNIA